jgi:ferric-dicitrate binding protein FerR (iron transport regulator)
MTTIYKERDIEKLFIGYFSNSLSSDELEELKNRINRSPEIKEEFQKLKKIWFSCMSDADGKRLNNDQAMQKFLLLTGKAKEPEYPKKKWHTLWQSAAAVAILTVASYALFKQVNQQMNEQFAEITIEAPVSSTEKIHLPDGTIVWLNAASKLIYSQGFGISEREVYLSGEGYFEVTRNENLPFSVKTDELQVRVVGTKFNLKNYTDDSEATICLLEGKVLIDNLITKSDEIIMEPDQRVFFDKKTGNTRLTQVAANNTAEWTNGNLFFDEELLQDIAKSLERCYDVKITIHPDLANVRLYGGFSRKEQTVNDILEILFSTEKMKYSISGKEIIINPL